MHNQRGKTFLTKLYHVLFKVELVGHLLRDPCCVLPVMEFQPQEFSYVECLERLETGD